MCLVLVFLLIQMDILKRALQVQRQAL